jgi:hypothetical protein
MKLATRASSPVLFIAIGLVAGAAIAAPPESKGPKAEKDKPEKDKDLRRPPAPPPAPAPTPTTAPGPAPVPKTAAIAGRGTAVKVLALAPATTPAAPAAVKGWPSSIQTGVATNCFRAPLATEVIVFKDPNFAGPCAVLTPGFYPYAANLVLGNDAISSIKVGSAVRARAFADAVYAGSWTIYAPNTVSGGLGPWTDKISSMRIEPATRSPNCNDLQEGEIALFESASGTGDCVVLPADGAWANAEAMGIENDSITSAVNNSSKSLWTFWNTSFNKPSTILPPHSKVDQFHPDGTFNNGIDDSISSIQMR